MKIPAIWSFTTDDVAANFDTHVRQQLPWYDLATRAVACVAQHYVPQHGLIYDIGASTGNIGVAMASTIRDRSAEYVAIDSSPAMRPYFKAPSGLIVADAVDFNYRAFDLAVCFLVLMFIPASRRQALIAHLKAKVKPGGAIVIFDKMQPVTGYPATVMAHMTLQEKINAGLGLSEIMAKEHSLIGIQRPLHPSELGEACEIFRFGDFAGWLLEQHFSWQ